MRERYLGGIYLFLAALIWGSSFIVMKDAVSFLSPGIILWIRFSIATIVMGIFSFSSLRKATKSQYFKGILTGICLFLAYIVQSYGLQATTPSKNAFLTSTYCAFVPFLVWLLYGKFPDRYQWCATLLTCIGIGCISLEGDLTLQLGDGLTLVSSVLFALHILAITKFSKEVPIFALITVQFAVVAILSGITALLFEDVSMVLMIDKDYLGPILYLSIFCTAVALALQNIGQTKVSECSAAIILSLEAVFGALFSVLFYGEIITLKVGVGFVLVFMAIIISETKLSFIKRGEVE